MKMSKPAPLEVYIKNEVLEEKDKEIERLNNIIEELEKELKEEIARTKEFILEEPALGEINNIRRMINETRQNILIRIRQLKEGKK